MSPFCYGIIPVGIFGCIYLIRKFREYQWGWVRSTTSLKDKVFIITGANTGLGYETTKALVKRHATVIMACRNMEKAKEALANIRKETANGVLIPLELDLASFNSIRSFVTNVKSNYQNFDCIINNAGLAVKTPQLTKENFELHFGTNHLGHFLLINLLKENILSNNTRIVIVASKMHERGMIDFENLGKYITDSQPGRTNKYYNDSKLANFYFGRELYKQGFDTCVLCPGLCYTDFFRDYNPKWYHFILFSPVVWLLLRSAKQGAQNIIYCATESNINSEKKNPKEGYYISSLKQQKSKFKFVEQDSERLWKESEEMCVSVLK